MTVTIALVIFAIAAPILALLNWYNKRATENLDDSIAGFSSSLQERFYERIRWEEHQSALRRDIMRFGADKNPRTRAELKCSIFDVDIQYAFLPSQPKSELSDDELLRYAWDVDEALRAYPLIDEMKELATLARDSLKKKRTSLANKAFVTFVFIQLAAAASAILALIFKQA